MAVDDAVGFTREDVGRIATELGGLAFDTPEGCERAAELARQLGVSRLRAALPALLPLVIVETWLKRPWYRSGLHADAKGLAMAALKAVSEILRAPRNRDLFTTDQLMRPGCTTAMYLPSIPGYWGHWARIDAKDIPTKFDPEPGQDLLALGLLAGHPRGQVREAAVVRLAMLGPSALPWLLVRVNDWVEPVRRRAQQAVTKLLTHEHASAFVDVLPSVFRLRELSRADHASLVSFIFSLLLAEDEESLAKALRHSDVLVRRSVVRMLSERPASASSGLMSVALRDDDRIVRWTAAGVTVQGVGEEWRDPKRSLCDDSWGRIRAQGLALLASEESTVAGARLHLAIFDSSRPVREAARFALKEIDPAFDAAAQYRLRLEGGETTVTLVEGLGETGSASDWDLLIPALDRSPSIARAAIWAMRRLNAFESREYRLMTVETARRGVSKDATLSLTREILGTDEPTLRQFLGSEHQHVREHAIALAAFLPRWRAPLFWLEPRAATTEHGQVAAKRWIQRRWTTIGTPTQSESAELRRLLALDDEASAEVRGAFASLLRLVAKG